jgi:hypothetical protein
MNSTEDHLRDALKLLEQRAPHLSPSTTFTESTAPRLTRRGWLLPLAAAAAVIVVVAVVAALGRSTGSNSPPANRNQPATTTANPQTTACLQNAAYRQGADRNLVPATPSSLTICQYPRGSQSVVTTTTDTGALVSALNALPTTPIQTGCRPRYPGALPARGTYELHFHYNTGPDVVVNVGPECRPSINNSTNLQADNAGTIVAILQDLVPAPQNRQYQALAINTSCVVAQCQHVRSPGALASLVHATSCTAWQLNPGSHGGPTYLVRLLIPTALATHDRSQIARLPGVHNVHNISTRNINRSPTAGPNFAPPTPVRCG